MKTSIICQSVKPSHQGSCLPCGMRHATTFFIATTSPVKVSTASATIPYEPLPAWNRRGNSLFHGASANEELVPAGAHHCAGGGGFRSSEMRLNAIWGMILLQARGSDPGLQSLLC